MLSYINNVFTLKFDIRSVHSKIKFSFYQYLISKTTSHKSWFCYLFWKYVIQRRNNMLVSHTLITSSKEKKLCSYFITPTHMPFNANSKKLHRFRIYSFTNLQSNAVTYVEKRFEEYLIFRQS